MFRNTLTISGDRPSQWPMIIFVAEHHKNPVRCIVSSSDDKTFASVSESGVIYICDSAIGHCTSGPFRLRDVDLSDWGTGLDACFSPDGKHVLVRYRPETILSCHAVVWDTERGEEEFQIEGFNFAFIHCGRDEGRIASMHWIDEDGSLIGTIAPGVQRPTRILVKLWDIGNHEFDGLFDITGVAVAQFSPNGKYLAVERQSESVVELWNLEDGKITHRFSHPPGNLSSFHFSPTNDYVTAEFEEDDGKCLRRLDTQQMVSLNIRGNSYNVPPAVIHSSHTNRIFSPRYHTVEVWEVSTTGSNIIFEIEQPTGWMITSI